MPEPLEEPSSAFDGSAAPPPRASFVGNAAWLLIAEVVGKVASFVFVVLVANGLGAESYGYFNFGVSFIPLFMMFSRWGINAAVTRDVAKDPDRISELFSSGLFLRVALGAAGLILSLLVAPLFVGWGQAWAAVAIVGVALFLDEIASFQGAIFKAFERMAFYALETFVNRLLSMALAVIVLAAGGGLIEVCVMYLAGSAGAVVAGAIALARYFPPVRLADVNRGRISLLLREGVSLGIAGLLSTALFRVDAVILQAVKGPVQVGLYGVAYRFFDSLLFVTYGLTALALPMMSRAGRGADSSRTYQLVAALLLSFYVPIAVGSFFSGRWVLELLFEDTYSRAAPAMVFLTGAGVFYAIAYLSRIGVIALGDSKQIAWIAAVALTANLAMNAFLIPTYGFVGAAGATLGAQVIECILVVLAFARINGLPNIRGTILAPLLSGAIMAATLVVTGLRDAPAIGVGAGTYLVALLVFALLSGRDETKALVALMRRSSGRMA